MDEAISRPPSVRPRVSLAAVFGVVFVDLLGFGIVIPQLGIYGYQMKASPFLAGLLLSVYSLMQFVFSPLLGRLSDRVGRKPVLVLSVLGSLLGYLCFAYARALPWLFVSRIVDGISGGNLATAQAYVADITREEDRARGMGVVGAALGLGFVLGPGIGGVLGAWGGNLAIGLGAAALCLCNLIAIVGFLPESKRADSAPTRTRSLRGVWTLRHVPIIGACLAITLVLVTAFAQMEGTFSVYLISRFLSLGPVAVRGGLFLVTPVVSEALAHEASVKSGYLFLAIGVLAALIQGGLIGRLRKRLGEPVLIALGAVAAAAGLFLLPSMPTYAWLFLPMGLLSIGSALYTPSLSALVSIHAPAGRQGETLGAYQSASSLGRILGPAAGGLLFAGVSMQAPYWVAGAMVLVAVVMAVRLVARRA